MKTTGPFTAKPGTARGRTPTIGSGGGRCTFEPPVSPCWAGSNRAHSSATCARSSPGAGMTGCSSASSWRCGPTAGGGGGTWTGGRTRRRGHAVFQRLTTLEPAALGAEELTPEELPFLRFEPAAQEVFDAWRGDLEHTLRAEEDHPVWCSHVAKYRSLMPSLALIGHLIDGVAGGPTGPVSDGAAARAAAWCAYLQGHARRFYASVTDRAQVAAALLAAQLTHGRLPSPFTARDVYRNAWTGLTEPRVVQGALEGLTELGWLRPETVRADRAAFLRRLPRAAEVAPVRHRVLSVLSVTRRPHESPFRLTAVGAP